MDGYNSGGPEGGTLWVVRGSQAGAWRFYMPMMEQLAPETLIGFSTRWMCWLVSFDGMVLLLTLPSPDQLHANPAHWIRGCMWRPRLWSARGWDIHNAWGSNDGSLTRSAELISPWSQNGTPLLHARDGTGNIMEPAIGQSDGAQPVGLQCEIYAVKKVVPLTISQLPGFLSHVEWLVLALQHPEMGG